MKKVIIFGATGTVGAYTSLFLKDLGYDKTGEIILIKKDKQHETPMT